MHQFSIGYPLTFLHRVLLYSLATNIGNNRELSMGRVYCLAEGGLLVEQTLIWGLKNSVDDRKSHSPDGSGILFLTSFGRKRYNGQLETAPKINKFNHSQLGTKKPPISRKAVFVYSFITFPFLS